MIKILQNLDYEYFIEQNLFDKQNSVAMTMVDLSIKYWEKFNIGYQVCYYLLKITYY